MAESQRVESDITLQDRADLLSVIEQPSLVAVGSQPLLPPLTHLIRRAPIATNSNDFEAGTSFHSSSQPPLTWGNAGLQPFQSWFLHIFLHTFT